jgi:cytochrome c-type biogenesis protein CcmH/NrfG
MSIVLVAVVVMLAIATASILPPLVSPAGRPYPGPAARPAGAAIAGSPGRSALGVAVVLLVAVAFTVPNLIAATQPRVDPAPATPPDTIEALQGAVDARPDAPRPRLRLARALFAQGRIGEAAPHYLAVAEAKPRSAEAEAHLGLILALSGEPRMGLRAIDRVLERRPGYTDARVLRALALWHGLGRTNAAAQELRRFIREEPAGDARAQAVALLEELQRGAPAAP